MILLEPRSHPFNRGKLRCCGVRLRPASEPGNGSTIRRGRQKTAPGSSSEARGGHRTTTRLGRAAPTHGSPKHTIRSRWSTSFLAKSHLLRRSLHVLCRSSADATGRARKAQCTRHSARSSFDILSRPAASIRWLSHPPSQRHASRLPAGACYGCQPAHRRNRGGPVSADRRHSRAPTRPACCLDWSAGRVDQCRPCQRSSSGDSRQSRSR